jgi:thioredoxin-dependent peroxiredoxin
MATTRMNGTPIATNGDLPDVGETLSFTLTDGGLQDRSLADFPGWRILNVFPSIDTPTCAASVRTFNRQAGARDGVTVLAISADLPFAQKRFCGVEGIEHVETLSTFRSGFLEDTGLLLTEGPLAGLAARAVLVLDPDGAVIHRELVADLGQEPDYDAALAALPAAPPVPGTA